MNPRPATIGLLMCIAGCATRSTTPPPPTPAAPASPAAELTPQAIPLPGITGAVSLDYLVYEPGNDRVWVPVGNSGSVDVLEVRTAQFDRVNGFKTAEREVRGRKRIMGPSAVTMGDGVAYVGNRATREVCAVDQKPLKLGECLTLPQATDGVAYVASAKEVWVTTPEDHSLTVLDASDPRSLKPKAVVKLDGETEGYGVDEGRGLFFTNLEDKDRTVVVDIKTRQTKAIWKPECGEAGPRGLAVDTARNFVIVACTDHIQVLDAAHEGALLGKLDAGGGIDNVDYLPARKLLYVAAGRAAKLTILQVDDKGTLTLVASGPTVEGARNAVADAKGNAYVADPANAKLLVFPYAR